VQGVERSEDKGGEVVYWGGLGTDKGRRGERLLHVPPTPHTLTHTRNLLYTENAFDFIFFSNNEKKHNGKEN
jgi:hypothetical protein